MDVNRRAPHHARLAQLTQLATTEHLLVALDLDGTLATLQDDPSAVRMLPDARSIVTELANLPNTTVALISGRALADLMMVSEHTADSPFHLAGSHGTEFWHPELGVIQTHETVEPHDRIHAVAKEAAQAIANVKGAWIEQKPYGFALHTRLAGSNAAIAQQSIHRLMRKLAPDWRQRTGHDIVEYASRHEGKDAAVTVLRERTGATAVLYAGDDVTDEDALASLGADDFGIRVGTPPGVGTTSASLSIHDPAALVTILRAVAQQRVATLT